MDMLHNFHRNLRNWQRSKLECCPGSQLVVTLESLWFLPWHAFLLTDVDSFNLCPKGAERKEGIKISRLSLLMTSQAMRSMCCTGHGWRVSHTGGRELGVAGHILGITRSPWTYFGWSSLKTRMNECRCVDSVPIRDCGRKQVSHSDGLVQRTLATSSFVKMWARYQGR